MSNHIDLNDSLAEVPSRTSVKTDDLVATAGQAIKIESSPGGEGIELGTVPAGKKWITSYLVYVEEVDA